MYYCILLILMLVCALLGGWRVGFIIKSVYEVLVSNVSD